MTDSPVSPPAKRRRRRWVVALLVATALGLVACQWMIDRIGGAYSHRPEEMADGLSPGSRELLDAAYADIDGDLVDVHTHIVGLGAGGTGAEVNPNMRTAWHPFLYLKFRIYKSAAGISDEDNADTEYVDWLVALIRAGKPQCRHHVLAFDRYYLPDGTVDPKKTNFYVPNEYVVELAEKYPDCFVPVMSVHPYRGDAIAELEKWAARGVKLIKWLPNAQGMDPGSRQCDPFYDKMKELDLVLLSHAGHEAAVDAEEDQRLGNPLLLRRPLSRGVKVIVAHCAGTGQNPDIEKVGTPDVDNFELFLRLMEDDRYDELLYADISAVTQFNRMHMLAKLLERTDLHDRLVNGSDYPLPAINALVRTGALERMGYITETERDRLNEIYDYNPLLFDYVLKRTLKHPVTKQRFPASVFMSRKDRGF